MKATGTGGRDTNISTRVSRDEDESGSEMQGIAQQCLASFAPEFAKGIKTPAPVACPEIVDVTHNPLLSCRAVGLRP
ncbi:hypothetical protein HDF16_005561 [Granulicella aggregans]|uniref:Uncharacterized protein n=1 Tax=Granulicella aggregans TaxID=474949 RepID=A0A7W7ZJ06_9BACT|nr:hypothetical protein [Granulicella aggregans]